MDLYKKALRNKFRFSSPVGQLTVEDLFDLPLKSRSKNKPNLNDIAKVLNRELKNDNEEDFVDQITRPNSDLKAKFDIVLDVIEVKKEELAAALAVKKRREQKARLMELIARKQDEALESKSEEELQALLAELS